MDFVVLGDIVRLVHSSPWYGTCNHKSFLGAFAFHILDDNTNNIGVLPFY